MTASVTDIGPRLGPGPGAMLAMISSRIGRPGRVTNLGGGVAIRRHGGRNCLSAGGRTVPAACRESTASTTPAPGADNPVLTAIAEVTPRACTMRPAVVIVAG